MIKEIKCTNVSKLKNDYKNIYSCTYYTPSSSKFMDFKLWIFYTFNSLGNHISNNVHLFKGLNKSLPHWKYKTMNIMTIVLINAKLSKHLQFSNILKFLIFTRNFSLKCPYMLTHHENITAANDFLKSENTQMIYMVTVSAFSLDMILKWSVIKTMYENFLKHSTDNNLQVLFYFYALKPWYTY